MIILFFAILPCAGLGGGGRYDTIYEVRYQNKKKSVQQGFPRKYCWSLQQYYRGRTYPVPVVSDRVDNFAELLAHVELMRVED